MKFAFASALFAAATQAQMEYYGYCVISDPTDSNNVMGLAKLFQEEDEEMIVTAKVSGLNADQLHAFHVHAQGFTGDDCSTSLGHFNPFDVNHGYYMTGNPEVKRHVGDLKPLNADAMGVAEYMW